MVTKHVKFLFYFRTQNQTTAEGKSQPKWLYSKEN